MPRQAGRKLALLKRRQLVASMYLAGKTLMQIADVVGVNFSNVSRDLSAIRKAWLESAIIDFDNRKALELAKVDKMEAEAWEAWEKSKAEQVTTTGKKKSSTKGDSLEAGTKTEKHPGDPRFLTIIGWCVDKRCEVLGLNAPVKKDLVVNDKRPGARVHVYIPDNGRDPWPAVPEHRAITAPSPNGTGPAHPPPAGAADGIPPHPG